MNKIEKARQYQKQYRESYDESFKDYLGNPIKQSGRTKKNIKLDASIPTTLSVINLPAKEIFIDICCTRNFKAIEEVEALEAKINKLTRELSKKFNADTEDLRPIACYSTLSQAALERSPNNLLKASITIYLDELIDRVEQVDQDIIKDFIEEIANF